MTTHEAIAAVVTERANEIIELMDLGWSKDDAIARVRESSTLGVAGWSEVLAKVEKEVIADWLFTHSVFCD